MKTKKEDTKRESEANVGDQNRQVSDKMKLIFAAIFEILISLSNQWGGLGWEWIFEDELTMFFEAFCFGTSARIKIQFQFSSEFERQCTWN